MTTAEAISALREKMGITQQELAAKLGVTVTSVSRYENGREPSPQVLKKLADLAEFAKAKQLRDLFGEKRRADIVARIENLPSGGAQRRVTLDDLAEWAKNTDDIASYSKHAFKSVERLIHELAKGTIEPSDVQSQLVGIRETIRQGCEKVENLGEDIEVYIAPPDRPGTVTFERFEKIQTAKDNAGKSPKED